MTKVRIRLLVVCVLSVIVRCQHAAAAEPARQFLEALRERGHHDIALEYLTHIADSKLVPIDFRDSILYERGLTLIAKSEMEFDLTAREKMLEVARANLKEFVASHPNNLKVTSASLQLGNLLVKQANTKMRYAQQREKDRHKLTAEARKLYDESFQVFALLEAEIKQRLDRIPKSLDVQDKAQARKAEERNQLREDYLFALLLAAAVREETAETVVKGSKDFNDLLTDAAKRYGQIYESYRSRIAGQYALQYQGRCHFKLGKIKDAASFYAELLGESDRRDENDALRTLKLKTMPMALACWLHESEKKYLQAVNQGDVWLSQIRPDEDRLAEWQEVRVLVARAHLLLAKEIEGKEPENKRIKASREQARKLAQAAARYPSDFQREAQKIVAELGGPDRTKNAKIAKTFEGYRDAGKEALDAMQTADIMVQQLPAKIANEKGESARRDLERQLAEAQAAASQSRREAFEHFERALTLADEETKREDVNAVRYFLCYLRYAEKEFWEAATLGEFVARRYPESMGAKQCAKIALASYVNLYTSTESADKQFEVDSVMTIAEFIASQWKGHAEADEALGTLIPFCIRAGDVAKAESFLQRIPTESPKRAEAELKTGQAIWGVYLKKHHELRQGERDGLPAGVDIVAIKSELALLKERSQSILQAGIERTQQAGNLGPSTSLGVLSLCQIFIDTDEPAKAVALIEDAKIGLLPIVQGKVPAGDADGLADEVMRTVLRAYISFLGKSSDTAATVTKAQGVMAAMKASAGETPEGKQKLVATYLGLAKDLQQQLQLATSETRKSLSAGFELFLSKVRDESQDVNIRNWIADTYCGMGKELMHGGKLTATSQKYFEEAKKTFESLLAEPNLDPQIRTHARMQLAVTLRELGEFTKSTALFGELLEENNPALNVQVEAAKTYQLGAAASVKNSKMYLMAISGDKPDAKTKKNLIWGWGRISQMTAHRPQFVEQFHEARYNLAWCRYQYALLQDGDLKSKQLELAEKEISLTAKLYPELGGPQWRSRYDALIREVQKSNGRPASGLPPPPPVGAKG